MLAALILIQELTHRATHTVAPGTHRPEVLVTDDGYVVVVVQPEGKVKHRAYRFDADWKPMGKSFAVASITDEYGEPADHRAALVDGEVVVVYQSLVWKDGKPPRGGGPAEVHAKNQSLMLARFTLDGRETFRGPIVARSTEENFPDHCLAVRGDRLLVSTGGLRRDLTIREVDLKGSVLATHPLLTGEAIAGTIGNSLRVDGDRVWLYSGGLRELKAAALEDFKPATSVDLTLKDREQTFPTGNLAWDKFTLISYISRAAGGDPGPERNPYSPYLKILDDKLKVVADLKVGDGGFMHVHPTLARRDDRLYFAWSKADGRRPNVQIEEYQWR